MRSREAILAAIRAAGLPDEPAPPAWSARPDASGLPSKLQTSLEEAGGTLRTDGEFRTTSEALSALVHELGADTVHSAHPDLPCSANLDPESDPRSLAGTDLAVLPGALAVAECGAVWVTPRTRRDRAASLLAEHLALVVPQSALVADLHTAYEHIDVAAAPFGFFVSGPSKTADIEQALVIGAHGPRALTVLLTRG